MWATRMDGSTTLMLWMFTVNSTDRRSVRTVEKRCLSHIFWLHRYGGRCHRKTRSQISHRRKVKTVRLFLRKKALSYACVSSASQLVIIIHPIIQSVRQSVSHSVATQSLSFLVSQSGTYWITQTFSQWVSQSGSQSISDSISQLVRKLISK